MSSFGKPIAALIALTMAAVIVGSLASPVVPQSADHEGGPGCACHNEGVGLWVNGTDYMMGRDVVSVHLQGGESFIMTVMSQRVQTDGLIKQTMSWTPSMADNSKFSFDPQTVEDNSPQDQSPDVGLIITQFKITSPSEQGAYSISLSAQGAIITGFVTIRTGFPSSFASITNIQSPSTAKEGALVRMNVTIQNTGSTPQKFYVYATERDTGAEVLSKVYSEAPVPEKGTIILVGEFEMPNRTLTLTIQSGHVEENGDVDDDRYSTSIGQLPSPPSRQAVPLIVLANEWAPWIAITATSLGSIPLMGMYARKGKRLQAKGEKLTFAAVDCAHCALCRTAMSEIEQSAVAAKVGGYEPVDVGFVVGSIRTTDHIETVKELRKRAKVLVAFGGCSAFGLWEPGERRRIEASTRKTRKAVKAKEVRESATEARAVSDYVKVDLMVPGCPPPLQIVHDFCIKEFKGLGETTKGADVDLGKEGVATV